jgi:outer membrane protein assembly factor BamB
MKKPLLYLIIFALPGWAQAEEWPAWRGPRGDGSSAERNLPIRWSATENVRWKTAIDGIGHSSPVVFGDRIFLTTCLLKEQQRRLLCLDRRSGAILWQKVVVTAPLERKHSLNSFASSTPATDGKHVWVTFLSNPELITACYDVEGNLAWKKSPGKFFSRHGFCSSPILYKDMVIVNGDQDAEAYIVALDKTTGEERWRADRPNRTRSYCAPLLVEAAGKTQLVLSGSKCVASYDPDTGKQHWLIDGPTEQYVASLVYGEGLFFLTAGFPDFHNMAIRPDGSGNITKTHIVWHEKNTIPKKASYVPSPIAFDKYFYVVSDVGWLSCFEARTGKRLWLKQLGRHHSASPVLADGRLYFTDDDGITYVLKAGPTFEIVSRNALDDECYASPAISRGQIFIRTKHFLYCLGAR